MGHLEVKHLKSPKDKALYIHHLVKDLEALDMMLKKGLIEKEPIRIGAEQEVFITTNDFFPNNNSVEILDSINHKNFTTEIGKYNLEINSDPLELKNNCFSQLQRQLKELVIKAQKAAKAQNSKIGMTPLENDCLKNS